MVASPNAASPAYIVSAVVTPRPRTNPIFFPSDSVRFRHNKQMGPGNAAMIKPATIPDIRVPGSIITFYCFHGCSGQGSLIHPNFPVQGMMITELCGISFSSDSFIR